MRLRPEDPMRTKATDTPVEDGWRGARIGAETRDRARRDAARIDAQVDIGEPGTPVVTLAFLALTLLATAIEFNAFGTSPTTSELSRAGGVGIGSIATGAWWKLLASNLLHANLAHVFTNAFTIFLTGRWLEHLVGRAVMVATILWSAVVAGIGAVVVDVPTVSIGASGVAFGILGCAIAVDPRARTAIGIIARQLAVINVVLTFLLPGISMGGHFGGFAAGLAVGALCWNRTGSPDHPAGRRRPTVPWVLAAAWVPVAALLLAGPRVLPNEAAAARGAITARLLGRQLSGSTLSDRTRIDSASCSRTSDPLRYTCRIDDDQLAIVRFDPRDDQWSLSTAR